MRHEQALELLKSAGMSGYESKAYIALLTAAAPMNGYEVAKSSGVPRSTVYEILGKLVARGAAFEVNQPGNGTAYVALPAEALIGRLRRELSSTIDGLSEVLPTLGGRRDAHLVQHVHGRDGVLERTIDVLDGAQHDVFASLWPAEFEQLLPAMERAIGRGVEVSVITFGEVSTSIGTHFDHRFSEPEVVLARLGCRIFAVVADRDAAIIGGVDDAGVWCMWSDDPAVALVAAEYVRHDMALQVIGEHMHRAGLDDVWRTDSELERLRNAATVPATLRSAAGPDHAAS